MNSIDDILQRFNTYTFLLDGSEDDMPSYGKIPDFDSIEQGILLVQEHLASCPAEQATRLKSEVTNRLFELVEYNTEISDEEFEEFGIDRFDYETQNEFYNELKYGRELVFNTLLAPWLCDDPQSRLLDIIKSTPHTLSRSLAANALASLESISIRGETIPVLISCFDDYEPSRDSYGEAAGFFNKLTHILTQRLMWDERVEALLKRTKQFTELNTYTHFSRATIQWYIANHRATNSKPEQLEILASIAYEWRENGDLLPFLSELIDSELTDEERAHTLKSLFLNFRYHELTIEKIRDYLTGINENNEFTLWDHTYLIETFLEAYSDRDLPQKRELLEYLIKTRIGNLSRCIKNYACSYGMTKSSLNFFVRTVEEAKAAHKTELLNCFLQNYPDCSATEEIRQRYQQHL